MLESWSDVILCLHFPGMDEYDHNFDKQKFICPQNELVPIGDCILIKSNPLSITVQVQQMGLLGVGQIHFDIVGTYFVRINQEDV